MRLLPCISAAPALFAAVAEASALTPPVLPLIVRNPYLSTWLGNARDVPWSKWPMFYTGQEVNNPTRALEAGGRALEWTGKLPWGLLC